MYLAYKLRKTFDDTPSHHPHRHPAETFKLSALLIGHQVPSWKTLLLHPKASPLPAGRRPLDSGGWLLRRDRKRLPLTTQVPRPLFPRLRRLRSGFVPSPGPPFSPPAPLAVPRNGSCSVPDGPGYSPNRYRLLPGESGPPVSSELVPFTPPRKVRKKKSTIRPDGDTPIFPMVTIPAFIPARNGILGILGVRRPWPPHRKS
jgi:hypothetical protein